MLKRKTSRLHTHIFMKHLRYVTDIILWLSGQAEAGDAFNPFNLKGSPFDKYM